MNVHEFMINATERQLRNYLSFCIEQKCQTSDESLARYEKFIEWNDKVHACATRIIRNKHITELSYLINYLYQLRNELVSFGDSEGVDTETPLVDKVSLWIKENIENEESNKVS